MICVGVDLAAEPAATAVARLEVGPSTLRLVDLRVGADDDAIVAAADGADGVGIDCAFGWPVAFVEFVSAHADGRMPAVAPVMKAQRSGKIVTVSSVAGLSPSLDGGYAHYGAAKAAILHGSSRRAV